MCSLRLAAIAAVSLLTLTACGKDESPPAAQDSRNSLLAYVPAGTPYLGGNLEPIPNDVIDSFLQKMEPLTATLQTELVEAKAKLESHVESSDTPGKLLLAVLQEVDGKLNRAGLESLGLDLQAYKVFYGMGPFPVARMGLLDAGTLDATIQRILDRAGISAPKLNFQGQDYWRLAADEVGDHHSDFPAAVYVAILEDHLAISVFPTTAESELLPAFLGTRMPDAADAESRLQAISQKYGYTPYFAGLVDLQLLADEFLNPGSLLARSIGPEHADELAALSQECNAEFRGIIAHTPRLVMGSTELKPNAIGMQYVVETEPAIAQQLLALVTDLPLPAALSSRLLEFSFGLKVGQVRDFLREKAMAITQAPYQCEHLQSLNEFAAEGQAQLDKPMPPLVNNFRGLRLSLSKLKMGETIPAAVEGLLAVHVEQPEMFVGMAQMFLPDLSTLNLVKGNPPVQLPASLLPMPDAVAFAAMSESAIGVSIGPGEENALLPYLEQKSSATGTLLAVNYDTAAYLDFTHGLGDAMEDHLADMEDGAEEYSDVVNQIAEAIQQSYKAVADRSEISLKFTEDGVVMDSRMTFK